MTLNEYVAQQLMAGTLKHFSKLHEDYLQTALIKETSYVNNNERLDR
jgi:hypothetical protein